MGIDEFTNSLKTAALMVTKYDVCGNLDAEYGGKLRAQIEALADAQEDVELDLSSVCFVDSCGIGAIVSLHRRLLARGRRLKVTGLRGQPLQLFVNLQLIPVLCGHR
jgi:anti-anti-sigma factor